MILKEIGEKMNNPREQPFQKLSIKEIKTILNNTKKEIAKISIRKKILEDLLNEKEGQTNTMS